MMNVNHRPRRSGFVLVMTLALLVLAGLLLAGMARQSLARALESLEAEQELQRRWGSISCRRAFLQQAAEIFDPADESATATEVVDPLAEIPPTAVVPPPIIDDHLSLTVELSGMAFELVLADEDAKANLNTAYSLAPRPTVTQMVHHLSGSTLDLSINLRPHSLGSMQTGPVLESWGQVFSLQHNGQLRALQSATARMTCWGSGKLNYHRASREAINSICGLAAGHVVATRLLLLRQQDPQLTLGTLFQQLLVRQTQRKYLEAVLTDRSTCFSLWITIVSPEREWHELHVAHLDTTDTEENGSAAREDENSRARDLSPIADFVW